MAAGQSEALANSVPGGVKANAATKTLGGHLVQSGKLAPAGLERAQRLASESGERLEVILPRLGLVSERDLAEALASFLNLPLAAAKDFPDEPLFKDQFSSKFLKDTQLIPLADAPAALTIAAVNPLDTYAIDAVRFAVGKPVAIRVAYPADCESSY